MPLHSESSDASSSSDDSQVLKRSVAATVTSKGLLDARPRKGLTIFNHSTADLYIDFGNSVSRNDFAVKLSPGAYYEMPYASSMAVRGVWSQAIGTAFIREFI